MQVQPGIPSFPAPASDTIVLPDGTGNNRKNVNYIQWVLPIVAWLSPWWSNLWHSTVAGS